VAIFGRFNFGVVAAGVGLCGVAIALSPSVAAAPLTTGGENCMYKSAGEGGAGVVATSAGEVGVVATSAGEVGAVAPEACVPAAAPVADMAGIPMALPGPIPVVPAAPVIPVVPVIPAVPVAPVPLGAPIAAGAPVAAGAPLTELSGTVGGKGDPIAPPPDGAPVPGQPTPPGPVTGSPR
jgi:hypothetical protein